MEISSFCTISPKHCLLQKWETLLETRRDSYIGAHLIKLPGTQKTDTNYDDALTELIDIVKEKFKGVVLQMHNVMLDAGNK